MTAAEEQIDYVAHIILQGFERYFAESPGYLADKRDELSGRNKFQSLLYLNSCDGRIQEHVARTIGVSLAELQTAIRVLGRC